MLNHRIYVFVVFHDLVAPTIIGCVLIKRLYDEFLSFLRWVVFVDWHGLSTFIVFRSSMAFGTLLT